MIKNSLESSMWQMKVKYKQMKALLIIDMQKGSFTPATPRFDSGNVIDRINQLAEKFRQIKRPVIYIQHDGTSAGEFIEGTHDWEVLDELQKCTSDIFINKYANDCFYNSELKSTLDKLGVSELYITGCATDFCVEATIQSALTKEYNITVISNAHTTGDRPHLKAKKIIEHYNWIWQNMLPTKGQVSVKTMEEVLIQ